MTGESVDNITSLQSFLVHWCEGPTAARFCALLLRVHDYTLRARLVIAAQALLGAPVSETEMLERARDAGLLRQQSNESPAE